MSLSSELNLPPNVSGKVRGCLDLCIESIDWKTSKVFADVKIHVLWWGQREGVFCEGIKIDVNKKKFAEEPLRTLHYQVNTNSRLFQSYLTNCEPVKFEVFSSKTEDFIGSAVAAIPIKLHNIQENEQQTCRISSQILTSRQFSLGDFVVSMKVQLQGSKTRKVSEVNLEEPCKTGSKPAVPKVLKDKICNKENIQVVGNKKRISFRDPKPVKQSTLMKVAEKENRRKNSKQSETSSDPPTSTATSSSDQSRKSSAELEKKSTFMNYLSGEPMSRIAEHKVLNDLVALSPTQSMIEALDRIDIKPIKQQPSMKLNSIRITVSLVEFNPAGQLETQSFLNRHRHQKCVLKCVVTSKIFKSNEDVKIISPVFETAPQRISFGKEICQRIDIPTERNKLNVFVNFGFCVKPIEQQASTFFVGFARVNLMEVVCSKELFHKKCPIVNESDIKVGSVVAKLELGINELHFGRNLNEALQGRRDNVSVSSDELMSPAPPVKLSNQKVQTKSHPSNSNDDCDADRNYENKNMQTDDNSIEPRSLNANSGADDRDHQMVDVEKDKNLMKSKVYRGLLFIEGLRNVKDQTTAEYFITYEGFWNQCQESNESSVDRIFNYLKEFPVICDDSFLKRVQNNHLELKLWEKTLHTEKWIGSTRLPLHQFFIAFRDVAMIEHLSTNQLPIISIDTWTNFVSPLSSELFCQGKVLLAIGSENQIDYLKLLRNMHNLQLPVRKATAATQVEHSPIDVNNQMKNKLSAFIESLSNKLPEPSLTSNFLKPASLTSSTSSLASLQPQLRKTSELLETLQKALSQPPPAPMNPPTNSTNVDSDSSMSSTPTETIRIEISIEHASHLPKVIKKKPNRRRNKSPSTSQKMEFEPSAYATFESCLEHVRKSPLPENIVKSHEGFVYCTNVVKSCDPQWNKTYDAQLPLDVLTNPQKRFIVKVWRKVAQDSDMKAAPFEDAVVGFTAVDLSVLLTGLPTLSGYYNIMDFSGRCNGQIKLSLKPLENLMQHQDSSVSYPEMNSSMHPLSVDVETGDDGAALLSRTLKRKFTELDEITQRLKARLFDVTGDENVDPEDEFERDLNTAVEEMEEGNSLQDFGWLKNDSNGNVFDEPENDFQAQLNKILESQPSTSKSARESFSTIPTQRQVSGCSSSQSKPMAIDQLLKKYDLDTLINPNIFNNLLDPNLADSDSTPTLNPQQVNTDDLANVSGDSGDTTVSSILSIDQVQTIQKALQKASLADGSDQSSSRKDPDGENNISE